MLCRSCGCRLDEAARFCPSCGAKCKPAEDATAAAREPTVVYGAEPTKEYAGADRAAGATPVKPSTAPESGMDALPKPRPPKPPLSYQDSFEMTQSADTADDYRDIYSSAQSRRFPDSGWQDPYRSGRKLPHPTTPLRRVCSTLLCLLILLFGFLSMFIGASRIAFAESNVRRAYEKGTLAELVVSTKDGDKKLSTLMTENAVNSETNLAIPIDETSMEQLLNGPTVNSFIENLVVDFTQFFVFGRTPSLLNSNAITGFYASVSDEINSKIGYAVSDVDIETLGDRIDGGDLSFLSIDENGGYFKQKYGYDPMVISSFFSVGSLAVCAGVTLLCIILIFVINHGNTAAGLSFNATALIIFGVLNTIIAVAALILSLVRNIFLVSELLRSFAFAMGAISLVALLIGIIFAVAKTAVRNRI